MEPAIIRVVHGKQLFKETIAMASLDRSIRSELGYPLSSEPGQLWWLFMSEDNLIGFCTVIKRGNEYHLCHDYVFPQYRGNGIYQRLWNDRFDYCKGNLLTAVCTKMSLNTYLRHGFKIEKQTKNYTWVKLEVKNE